MRCQCFAKVSPVKQQLRDVAGVREDNLLKNAPHTAEVVMAHEWNHPYTREQAAFPAEWVRQSKFWPSTGRVDNVYGDRKLVAVITEEVLPLAAEA